MLGTTSLILVEIENLRLDTLMLAKLFTYLKEHVPIGNNSLLESPMGMVLLQSKDTRGGQKIM